MRLARKILHSRGSTLTSASGRADSRQHHGSHPKAAGGWGRKAATHENCISWMITGLYMRSWPRRKLREFELDIDVGSGMAGDEH